MDKITGFIGTYDSAKSKGIYKFTLDLEEGKLSKPELYYSARNTKHLSFQDGILISTMKMQMESGIFLLDTKGKNPILVDEIVAEEKTPCSITQKDGYVYTVNSDEETVMIYKLEDGIKVVRALQMEKGSQCHQALVYENFLFVICQGHDCIRIFDREKDFKAIGEIPFPEGSGPRYGAFDKKQKRLYIITEHKNRLFVIRIETYTKGKEIPKFGVEQICYVLDPQKNQKGDSLVVRISPDDKYLYISTRRANIITVFEQKGGHIKPIQYASCDGNDPGNFALTSDNHYMLVVNRLSNELVLFELDTKTGKIKDRKDKIAIDKGAGLVLAE